MKLGQLLFSILLFLIVLAVFGAVDWDTVTGWIKIMVYIFIAGLILLGLGILFTKNDN